MEEEGCWEELPPEILMMMFRFLDVASIYPCFTVNKRWLSAAQDDFVWSHFFLQSFGEFDDHLISSSSPKEGEQQQQQPAAANWIQRFREYAQTRFCFHPLLAAHVYLFPSSNFRTILREDHQGSCPKAVLSTERQLRPWLLRHPTSSSSFSSSSSATSSSSSSPSASSPSASSSSPQKEVEVVRGKQQPDAADRDHPEERKAMFCGWHNKAIRLQFQATRNWEVGLFHLDPADPRFNYGGGYFNSFLIKQLPFVSLSISDRRCYFTEHELLQKLQREPDVDVQGLRAYIKDKRFTLAQGFDENVPYTITVTVDDRKRAVRFEVNGQDVSGALSLPPHPFVMGFNTGYAAPELTVLDCSLLK
ncbi:hypothetical protein QOT17_022463 [Balamuthia mandrillaris]